MIIILDIHYFLSPAHYDDPARGGGFLLSASGQSLDSGLSKSRKWANIFVEQVRGAVDVTDRDAFDTLYSAEAD